MSHPQTDEVPARPVRTGAAAERRDAVFVTRWSAALILVSVAAVLGVAVWLTPDPRGFGTHEQFGGGPCGMLVVTGYPCPTCGMTTAFSYAVRGELGRAFLAQPAGAVLALVAVGLVFVSGYALVIGRWPARVARWAGDYRVYLALFALLVVGWGLKLVIGLATGVFPTHGADYLSVSSSP